MNETKVSMLRKNVINSLREIMSYVRENEKIQSVTNVDYILAIHPNYEVDYNLGVVFPDLDTKVFIVGSPYDLHHELLMDLPSSVELTSDVIESWFMGLINEIEYEAGGNNE